MDEDNRGLEEWAPNTQVHLVPVIEQTVEEKALLGIPEVERSFAVPLHAAVAARSVRT